MAKAVLIMDMPERCDMCDLRYTLPFGNKVCYIKLKGVTGEKRPDWCPLRELPEKKVADKRLAISPLTEGHLKDFEKGWNACLDAIDEK